MVQRWFADSSTGAVLGGYDGAGSPPWPNAVEVPSQPEHGQQTWDGSAWVGAKTVEPTEEEVTREYLRGTAANPADFDAEIESARGRLRGRRNGRGR